MSPIEQSIKCFQIRFRVHVLFSLHLLPPSFSKSKVQAHCSELRSNFFGSCCASVRAYEVKNLKAQFSFRYRSTRAGPHLSFRLSSHDVYFVHFSRAPTIVCSWLDVIRIINLDRVGFMMRHIIRPLGISSENLNDHLHFEIRIHTRKKYGPPFHLSIRV